MIAVASRHVVRRSRQCLGQSMFWMTDGGNDAAVEVDCTEGDYNQKYLESKPGKGKTEVSKCNAASKGKEEKK